MGDVEYAVRPIDSIVLAAADKAASSHGLKLSSPAKDFLISRSRKSLDAILENEPLEQKKAELERNTAQLIKYIADNADPKITDTITLQDLQAGMSLFCRLFPHFVPFCVNAE